MNERTRFTTDSFDLVNARFLAGGIGKFRWPVFLSDVYRSVDP